jgi:hypothetical protein
MTYTPLYTSATAVYSKTGLSSTEVNLSDDNIVQAVIQDAEVELEALTGRKFTDANARVEHLSGPKKDIINFGQQATATRANNYPIQSIVALSLLNVDGSVAKAFATLSAASITAGTYDTTDYWLETKTDPLTNAITPDGRIVLKTAVFPVGKYNILLSYTYGYASVPSIIRNLATCLAAMRAWVRFAGGSYNRIDSYSIPQQSVNKGDFYGKVAQNVEMLKEEAERILDRVGKRQRVLFVSSSEDR